MSELEPENVKSKLNRSFLNSKTHTRKHARVLWKPNQKKKSKLTATHSLKVLLQWLIDRLRLISNEKFDKNIRNTILELSRMDPKGQSFRYGLLKNGVFSIEYQKNFSLEYIYKNMEEVFNYLSGIDIFLTEETQNALDNFYEIQEEMRELENEALSDLIDFDDYD